MADTGNGTTFALGTTGAIGNVRKVNGREASLGSLDDSHLGTSGSMTFIPDDLTDEGEITFEVEFDETIAEPSCGQVETATLTYPSTATEIGTGFLTKVKKPTLENGSIQVMELTFKFDGKTGPTFTPSA